MLRPEGAVGRGLRAFGRGEVARRFVGPKVLVPLDRFAHRLTRGRVRPGDLLFDTVTLTTRGRRTGRPHTVTLAAFDLGGVPVVIASNFGREHHPAWSQNLLADPNCTVEHRGGCEAAVAQPLTEAERERVWPQALRVWPGYETYRRTTAGIRDIRMFALERS